MYKMHLLQAFCTSQNHCNTSKLPHEVFSTCKKKSAFPLDIVSSERWNQYSSQKTFLTLYSWSLETNDTLKAMLNKLQYIYLRSSCLASRHHLK